jgi:glycosyltransferase involved in cell wall biosynthesis
LRISSESSILLSTSDEEGFPQTFLESWSHGTPTVTLGIDPDRVIQELSLGAVCSDVQSAAAAISKLVGSPALREQMSQNARQYVARAHSPAAAVRALERAMVGSRSTPGVGQPSEGVAV